MLHEESNKLVGIRTKVLQPIYLKKSEKFFIHRLQCLFFVILYDSFNLLIVCQFLVFYLIFFCFIYIKLTYCSQFGYIQYEQLQISNLIKNNNIR